MVLKKSTVGETLLQTNSFFIFEPINNIDRVIIRYRRIVYMRMKLRNINKCSGQKWISSENSNESMRNVLGF